MLVVLVNVHIKSGYEEDFKKASIANAQLSLKEPGIARFDVIQDRENPNQFVLIEVYRDDAAPALHKETEHYKIWRDTVEPWMAEPRRSRKFLNCFPDDSGW